MSPTYKMRGVATVTVGATVKPMWPSAWSAWIPTAKPSKPQTAAEKAQEERTREWELDRVLDRDSNVYYFVRAENKWWGVLLRAHVSQEEVDAASITMPANTAREQAAIRKMALTVAKKRDAIVDAIALWRVDVGDAPRVSGNRHCGEFYGWM